MIVVDASLVIEIALATADGRKIQQRLKSVNEGLGAPELIDLEVLQVLKQQTQRREIDAGQTGDALAIFEGLSIERFSHQLVFRRIWALRENLTAYDAAYFSLAELLDAPLWTRDRKFRDVPGHHAQIEIL